MRMTCALVLALLTATASPGTGCRIDIAKPSTFRDEAKNAAVLVVATLTASAGEKAEFAVDAVLRDHAALKDKKKLVLEREIPFPDKKNPPRFLIFIDVHKGKLDPYRGIVLTQARAAEYVRKALALDPKDAPAALAFFFKHLADADPQVASDALAEFQTAEDADIVKAAPRLDVVRLRAWLLDPKVGQVQRNLYAVLLGTCGKKADLDLVRALRVRHPESDALHAAHVLLSPREGMAALRAASLEQKADFHHRFAALRAVRFLFDTRKGVVPEKDLVAAVCLHLKQDDVCDLALEELRRWKRWEVAGEVLATSRRPSLADNKVWNRALLRYCIQCKGSGETSKHVALMRAKDADLVKDEEGLLALEGGGK